MKPERLREVRNKIFFLTDDPRLWKYTEEMAQEIERLQALTKLPEGLEKKLGEIEAAMKVYWETIPDPFDVSVTESSLVDFVSWFIATIRALQVRRVNAEAERDVLKLAAEADATADAARVDELQAELTEERESVKGLSLHCELETKRANHFERLNIDSRTACKDNSPNAVASDKANTEEQP